MAEHHQDEIGLWPNRRTFDFLGLEVFFVALGSDRQPMRCIRKRFLVTVSQTAMSGAVPLNDQALYNSEPITFNSLNKVCMLLLHFKPR